MVFLHGFTGHKAENHRLFVEAARALVRKGFACLRFDFRGSGDSAGEFSEITVSSEIEDARTALAFVRSQDQIDRSRIGLVGMSLGGMIAALVLAEDSGIRAAALWCPVGDTVALIKRKGGMGGAGQVFMKGYFDMGGWPVGRKFVAELAATRPVEAVRTCRAPVLLIHGEKDESVALSDAVAYHEALKAGPARHEFHVIRDADHTFNSLPWTAEVLKLSVNWFRSHLA